MDALRVLFIGDSVTDCGRDRADPESLGNGYVARIATMSGSLTERPIAVVNRGISGNRVRDLRARWQEDCLDLNADVVSILIGVNDTWRRYDRNDPTTTEEYAEDYDHILGQLAKDRQHIVMLEPFVLPVRKEQNKWREDLEPKIHVVHELAAKYRATLVPLDSELDKAARTETAEQLAADGVHPTRRGHELIADIWMKATINKQNPLS